MRGGSVAFAADLVLGYEHRAAADDQIRAALPILSSRKHRRPQRAQGAPIEYDQTLLRTARRKAERCDGVIRRGLARYPDLAGRLERRVRQLEPPPLLVP